MSASLERGGVLTLLALAFALGRVPLSAVQASLESRSAAAVRVGLEAEVVTIDDPVLSERVRLTSPPRRIVSLTLASDVMLASLVEVDRVAGVTALVDDPTYSAAAGHYPVAIPRVSASAEALLALEPDLVVISAYSHPATARALVGAGVPVLRLPSGRSLDEVREAASLLGDVVGSRDRAAVALARFDRERAALSGRARMRPPRVLFYAAGGFTHGRGTLTDELIELAGADNVARELRLEGLTRIGAELVAASRPEVFVVPAATDDEAREALDRAGLSSIRGDARVIAIPSIEIESTSLECVEAARTLANELEREP